MKKRVGRPATFGAARTRGPLTIRLRDHVRSDLEVAATRAGRSLSEEVEYQLELALNRREYLLEQWGADVFTIAESAAKSLWHIERTTDSRWVEDDKTFDLFKRTLAEIVNSYRDLVLRNRRDTPHGSFEGKSVQQLAQMFAALGGMSPPRLPAAASNDRDRDAADRQAGLVSWRRAIDQKGSRPLPPNLPEDSPSSARKGRRR